MSSSFALDCHGTVNAEGVRKSLRNDALNATMMLADIAVIADR
jgi:hypothetical protein